MLAVIDRCPTIHMATDSPEPVQHNADAELGQENNCQRYGPSDGPVQISRKRFAFSCPGPERACKFREPKVNIVHGLPPFVGSIAAITARAPTKYRRRCVSLRWNIACPRRTASDQRVCIRGKLGCDLLDVVLKRLVLPRRRTAQIEPIEAIPRAISPAASPSLLSPSLSA